MDLKLLMASTKEVGEAPILKDIEHAVLDSSYLCASAGDAQGIFFKPDGTKFFIAEYGTDIIQYECTTPWVISSGVAETGIWSFPQDSYVHNIFFNPDGTKCYVTTGKNDSCWQFSLGTAWDITGTMTYDNQVLDYGADYGESTPHTTNFSPDGLTIIVTGTRNDCLYKYTTTTAWDFTGATPQVEGPGMAGTAINGVWLNSDGTKLIWLDGSSNVINQHTLEPAYDITDVTTASIESQLDISLQETTGFGIFFTDNGYLFMTGSNNSLYKYNITWY